MKKRILESTVAVVIIIAVTIGGYFVIRNKEYPHPYDDVVKTVAEKYELSPYLLYAVIKAESSFDETAESAKGAKGLMQLTDETAEYVAGLIDYGEYDLNTPTDNIELGAYYVKYLWYKFGSLNEVLCAYNAGEGKVKEWLSSKEYSKDGKRLTKVPYKETTAYVYKVRKYCRKYSLRLRNTDLSKISEKPTDNAR